MGIVFEKLPGIQEVNEFKNDQPYTLLGPAPTWEGDHADEKFDFKYNELEIIHEVTNYIISTYRSKQTNITEDNYYGSEIEPMELIISDGNGMGFALGNIIKYASRYGKKNGYNRKDLLKVMYYCIMALNINEKEQGKVNGN